MHTITVSTDVPSSLREPPRPPRPAAPRTASPSPAAPHRPPPPAVTADFLNIEEKQASVKATPQLKNEDSFDFFGMMEKPNDDSFGDFLSGQASDNTQVCYLAPYNSYGCLNITLLILNIPKLYRIISAVLD